MELVAFCEYLITRGFSFNEYAARMTLDGIIHYLCEARSAALQDQDFDDYTRHNEMINKIYYLRDMARIQSRKQ